MIYKSNPLINCATFPQKPFQQERQKIGECIELAVLLVFLV